MFLFYCSLNNPRVGPQYFRGPGRGLWSPAGVSYPLPRKNFTGKIFWREDVRALLVPLKGWWDPTDIGLQSRYVCLYPNINLLNTICISTQSKNLIYTGYVTYYASIDHADAYYLCGRRTASCHIAKLSYNTKKQFCTFLLPIPKSLTTSVNVNGDFSYGQQIFGQ